MTYPQKLEMRGAAYCHLRDGIARAVKRSRLQGVGRRSATLRKF